MTRHSTPLNAAAASAAEAAIQRQLARLDAIVQQLKEEALANVEGIEDEIADALGSAIGTFEQALEDEGFTIEEVQPGVDIDAIDDELAAQQDDDDYDDDELFEFQMSPVDDALVMALYMPGEVFAMNLAQLTAAVGKAGFDAIQSADLFRALERLREVDIVQPQATRFGQLWRLTEKGNEIAESIAS